MGTQNPGALGHIRVLDLTGEEGQLCGRMLAGLGADVIKIEPPGGDPVRHLGPFFGDHRSPETSLRWFLLNAGKRSVVLDLESPSGVEQSRNLAARADVVVESFTPGSLDRLGLGYAALRDLNRGLVLTSISGYGQSGPWSAAPWCDITVLAMGGLMELSGDEDRPPLRMSSPQSYFHASMQATVGTLLALYGREATGEGTHVHVSAQEALTMALEGPGPILNTWRLMGIDQTRLGHLREPAPGFRFPTVLPCQDGHVAVASVLGAALPRWLAALEEDGMAGDLADERWQTASFVGTAQPGQWVPAQADIDHVYEIVTRWTRKHTRAEIMESARRHHFLAGPQNTVADLLASEQLRARGYFVAVEHEALGTSLTYPGAPFRLSRTPWRTGPRAPRLGEHTEEVLGSWTRTVTS